MILVVEDNVDDSLLLTRQLARAHLNEVHLFTDGQRALDFLLQTSPVPSAVFLDLKLPRLSGIQLLQEIRRELRLYSLPVIVMTDSISPADAETCACLGVTAFLPKPIDVEIFRRIIGGVKTQRLFLARAIDPHFAELASPML